MKRDIKISVVMAVYNRVNVVEQAISSVVNQTYNNIEFIIIDGGSTDGTVDIIKKYEDKIAYWESESDTGIYNALNKGVRHASGDYIQILGSDDCLHDEKTIENVVKELDDNTDVLCCDVYFVDSHLGVEWVRGTNENFLIQAPNHQGMFTKRSVLLKYPFDEQYKVSADYNFMLTCYTEPTIRIKRSKLKVAYYAIGGFSGSQAENCLKDMNAIYCKFTGQKMERETSEHGIKAIVKKCMKKIGVFERVRYFINVHILRKWKKHHCNNKICRWCGRS